jgi:imidazoleglycerol-phosphate dehydratase
MRGINRYADITLPMDEALILCAVDISGRDYLNYAVTYPYGKIGDFDVELVQEFMLGFVRNAGITLHISRLYGTNCHHIAEGVFKALARVLGKACAINEDYKNEIPSTKGVL